MAKKKQFATFCLFVLCFALTASAQNREKTEATLPNDSITDLKESKEENISTLQEVTIEASPVATVDDKMLFTPPAYVVENSQFVIDMLSKLGIPGLDYDIVNRSITCNNSSPVILIDGIPSSQTDLKNIKASEVLNVEFTNFVPVKYSRYGSGSMINVRLKKQRDGGTWNITEQNDFTGKGEDANTALFFYQGASRFNLSGDFSFRNNKKTFDTFDTEYTNPNLPITIREYAHSPFSYRWGNASLQYSYAPSPSLLVTAKYNFGILNSHRSRNGTVFDSFNGGYSSGSKYRNNDPSHNVDLYVSKDLGTKNSIDVNLMYSNNVSDVTNTQIFDGAEVDDIIPYNLHSRRNVWMGALDYGHKFSDKSRIDLYYSMTTSRNVNEYVERGSSFASKELNQLVYLQYQGELWKNSWIAVKTGLKADRVTDSNRPRTLLSNTSELILQWQVTKEWILKYFGFYNSSTVPLSTYDNTLVQSNLYLYNQGNPDIKASNYLSNGVMAMFNKKGYSISFTASNNQTFNPIFTVPRYDSSLKAYLQTPFNGKNGDVLNVRLQANSPLFFNMLSVGGNISYFHGRNTLADGWKLIHNSVGGRFQIVWQYKKWNVHYFKTFPIKTLHNLTISNLEEYNDGIGVNFSPDNKLFLALEWMYMFSKKGWKNYQTKVTPELTSDTYREIHENKNWIRFAISYNLTFGSPFKGNDKQRSLQIRDNQKIYNDYSR